MTGTSGRNREMRVPQETALGGPGPCFARLRAAAKTTLCSRARKSDGVAAASAAGDLQPIDKGNIIK